MRTLPCRRPLRSRYKNCIATQLLQLALLRSHRATAVSHHCIAALLRCIVTPKVFPSHDTNYWFATNPIAKLRACALPHALARSRPCCGPCWPCRGAVSQGLLAMSWPPDARPNALFHDTIHCIVTQTGKWAIAHSSSCLFYNFFFTHFVPPTRRPQKIYYYFFFHFPVEPNKFI